MFSNSYQMSAKTTRNVSRLLFFIEELQMSETKNFSRTTKIYPSHASALFLFAPRCHITATERSNGERIRKHVQKSRKRTFRSWKQFLFLFYFLLYNFVFFLIHHFSHYLVANLFLPHKITKFLKIVKIPCEKSLFDRKTNI